MHEKTQQYKLPGVLTDPKKETITVHMEYIDVIKRGGAKYIGNAADAPVESVGPATEFCHPCFAHVQPGHTCPTWTKRS
jgi:hypothetical protein